MDVIVLSGVLYRSPQSEYDELIHNVIVTITEHRGEETRNIVSQGKDLICVGHLEVRNFLKVPTRRLRVIAKAGDEGIDMMDAVHPKCKEQLREYVD